MAKTKEKKEDLRASRASWWYTSEALAEALLWLWDHSPSDDPPPKYVQDAYMIAQGMRKGVRGS